MRAAVVSALCDGMVANLALIGSSCVEFQSIIIDLFPRGYLDQTPTKGAITASQKAGIAAAESSCRGAAAAAAAAATAAVGDNSGGRRHSCCG